jgi:nickel/cobalt exporter
LNRVSIRVALWVTLVCVILGAGRAAGAHPAGFTSVNRYVGVQCDGDGRLHVSYLIDFAELPSYAELDQLDRDHDGTLTPDEQRAYLDRRLPPLVGAWSVEIDGVRGSPRVTGSSLEVTPGERGLSTLRIAADVVVERPRGQAPGAADVVVIVQDPSFADHPGWREMSAEDSPGATVVSGPTGRAEDALAYAPAARASPPRIDQARFAFRLRAAALDSARGPVLAETPVAIDARLSAWGVAMKKASGSALFSALAVGLAFALGAAHALSPGHGKTLAAAYLVGRRARSSQAFLFGATVTVSHTVVVFVVGCLALTIERTVGSEHVLRLLELGSAVAIVVLAIVQLSQRWNEVTREGHEHSHDATLDLAPGGVRSLLLLGASAGVTPCPSALAILLAAIAVHRYGFGLVLVLVFSLGVAATLTVTGLLVVFARRLLDRATGARPLIRWLPVVSSAGMLAIGVLLCASVLRQP